jgi:hypothetical protein
MSTLQLAVVRSLVEQDGMTIDKGLVMKLLDTVDAYVAWSDAWQRIAQSGDVEMVLAELRAERPLVH